jgi:hypothetical protein
LVKNRIWDYGKLVGIGWVRFSFVFARRNDEAMTELKGERGKGKAKRGKPKGES